MSTAHRKSITPDSITFVAISKGEDGWPHEVAAIRVADDASFGIEDFFHVSLGEITVPTCAAPPGPFVSHETCARGLSRILEHSRLAAWDVEQVMSDIDEVLADGDSQLEWDGGRPIDVSSLVRPFLRAGDELDDACDWARVELPSDAAASVAGAVLAVTRRAFKLARAGQAVVHQTCARLAG
jgi:hypothetical protein